MGLTPWAPIPGQYASLPEPVAQTANQVVWLANGDVWISTFELEGWTQEQSMGGGIVQGCD